MKKLMLSTALIAAGFAVAAQAEEITVLSWGGQYEKSQVEAYAKPFTAARTWQHRTDDLTGFLRALV